MRAIIVAALLFAFAVPVSAQVVCGSDEQGVTGWSIEGFSLGGGCETTQETFPGGYTVRTARCELLVTTDIHLGVGPTLVHCVQQGCVSGPCPPLVHQRPRSIELAECQDLIRNGGYRRLTGWIASGELFVTGIEQP